MAQQPIRFDDGAAYERLMGAWSQLVGQVFLDWLSPARASGGSTWAAATELSPNNSSSAARRSRFRASIHPKGSSLSRAPGRGRRARYFSRATLWRCPSSGPVRCRCHGAGDLFVPDPAKGVREMARVVRPGGLVAAYVWDALGGRDPIEPILTELRAMGITPAAPPSVHVSSMEALHGLWTDAGLEGIETRDHRAPQLRQFRRILEANTATGVRATLDPMDAGDIAELRSGSRASPGRRPGADHTWRARQRGKGPRAEDAVIVK